MSDRGDERNDPSTLASEIRSVPRRARRITQAMSDAELRQRPGVGEWSAIEVIGHLIDKMTTWHGRARAVKLNNEPDLASYDQDAAVADANYQHAVLYELHGHLTRACEEFARTVEVLDSSELDRRGRHAEYGPITLRECVTLPLDSVHDHLQQARHAANTSNVDKV